ncbi:MAG TPA: hypothetical protein VK619_06525 [Pyrinomonadaceae bacterium]|nr:hypothetical protein [Pyrinomonadaceae bacterium]
MKKRLILVAAAILCSATFFEKSVIGQTDESRRFEVGFHFTSLTLDSARTEPGLGARITYNATRNIAVEAEFDTWPHNARSILAPNGGRAAAVFAGVKIGKRYDRWGIFAKVRPGVVTFTQGRVDIVPNGSGSQFPFDLLTERSTHFALDVGGVLEFYPTKRIVTRFDAGDTNIRYGATTVDTIQGPIGGPFVIVPVRVPPQTIANFQFSAGVGFRF